MSKTAKRLFTYFRPEDYQLQFDIDHDQLNFSGSVTVRGKKVNRPSSRLTFHQKGLRVTSASITKHGKNGDEVVELARIVHHKASDEVRLHTTAQAFPGEYTITMQFEGMVTEPMEGIYPSRFTHKDKEHTILTTQFESHHARKAFPCIDEPEAKATFSLTLKAQKDFVTLSNMPEKSKKIVGSLQTVIFETTPIMSSYLLGFVVGDLHSQEAKAKDGTLVRSWSAINQPKSHLTYSVTEAVKILEYFAEYFDTPYPLEKYDQVALPDFDAGAMENWGMATFREIVLLADPDNKSISTEQYVSLVVAHELSHQWFGNLVTMKWWDDLWLNESFASLMEHLALDATHPDWQQWELYASMDIVSTSSRDVYKNIQPVGAKVTDPDLIETLFDPGIVYAKGGRLLKMLREFIGDDAFRVGLKDYFTSHAYKNATRNDLWRALSKSSEKDVDALMTPWITQPGMPVLHVSQQARTLEISQERFTLDDSHVESLWPIPLLARESLPKVLMTKQNTKLHIDNDDPVLINQFGSGHYFVDYQDPNHRKALVTMLSEQALPPEARINVLNDAYMLARQGARSLVDNLELIRSCENEPRDSVWSLMMRSIGAAHQLTEGDQTTHDHLNRLKVTLAQKQYRQLGWDDKPSDDANTKQLRHTMLALMIGGEDKEAIQFALNLYALAKELTDLPAEIRNTILGTAVRFGSPDIIDKLLAAYPGAPAEVQLDITGALVSTRDPAVAKHIMATALGEAGFVRPQDLIRWLVGFIRNHYVRDIGWAYMVDNWAWVYKTIGASKSFDYLPTYCASIVTTPAWLKKYKIFFDSKSDIKVLAHNVALGEADARARIAWRQRDEQKIVGFFTDLARH